MIMLNLPTLVEQNNDYVVNGTILKCSPQKHQINVSIKKFKKFSMKRLGH